MYIQSEQLGFAFVNLKSVKYKTGSAAVCYTSGLHTGSKGEGVKWEERGGAAWGGGKLRPAETNGGGQECDLAQTH